MGLPSNLWAPMPNITNILNEEIRRLARREIKSNTGVVRKQTAQYRRDIAELKRQVASLSKAVAFLGKQEKRRVAEQPVGQEVEGRRFRADGLRSHRAKLGLSAKDYGLLVGVTGQTIYNWEEGKGRPRQQQVSKVAAVRGIGKREAMKRLELLGATVGQARPRGRFDQTAVEFITLLVQGNKATHRAEIGTAWTKAGRGGRADNTLTRMVKAGSLKRTKVKGEKGSKYSVA